MRIDGRREAETGNTLVSVLIMGVVIGGLVWSSMTTTTQDLRSSVRSLDHVRTLTLAEAGVERTIGELRAAARRFNTVNPLTGIQALFAGGIYTPFTSEPLVVGGTTLGEFTVTVTAVANGPEAMELTIDSTGYYPASPASTPAGAPAPRRQSLRVTLHAGLERSRVFDHGYFLNNWGWFYGTNLFCNGNARSNGQFDCGGYAPTISGQPLYDSLTWAGTTASLGGYQDDNMDGLHDGNDGGLFSAWDIVGSTNVQGNGGLSANQHDFQAAIEMPNLTNLQPYEARAIATGANVRVGATTLFTGVYGDDPGELQNIVLIGTAGNPIEINGTVVVRGNVLISGVIKGQGAIYAGDNVYVPNDLTYANGPATSRPVDNTEVATEAWLTANANKDFVALLARENVVVGDHTDGTWRSHVNGWINHSANESAEDSGEDLIPNTANGKDGIAGTADDDVLEGDGIFTTEVYSAADAAAGLIPPGFNIGDPIPGTGEDIDGDGVHDPRLSLADLDLPVSLDSSNWGGTILGPITYNSIANNAITRLDGVFYTNHAFAWMTLPSAPIHVNGSIVSRNESIIYGGPSMNINYDCRLLGGAGVIGDMLPRTLAPFRVLAWMKLDNDPNHALSGGP